MKTVAALASILLAVILAGCGEADRDQDSPTEGGFATEVAPPGLYELEEGRAEALGVLAFRELEGGFWAVVAAYPGQEVEDAQNVAVIANPDDLDVDLEVLAGSYVRAEGTPLDGASIRMAGPELEVDILERIEDVIAPPGGPEGS
jgi:hypothetical protein